MSASHFGHQDHKPRQGPCQNCGWNQSLHKVTGPEAALIRHNSRFGPRFGLRWLCEECVIDLTSGEHVQPEPAQVRHRSVA